MNSLLVVERAHSIPLISTVPTLILGMDVSHGSPGQSDVPSIAAVIYCCFSLQFCCIFICCLEFCPLNIYQGLARYKMPLLGPTCMPDT